VNPYYAMKWSLEFESPLGFSYLEGDMKGAILSQKARSFVRSWCWAISQAFGRVYRSIIYP